MQLNTKNVMLDLETLGTAVDAVIISIGAVEFNPYTGTTGREFYERISWQSAIDAGRTVTEDTLKWWLKQSNEALSEVLKPGLPLTAALLKFTDWYPHDYDIWSNGANFDVPMLEHALASIGMKTPWAFWAVKDVRTIRDIAINDVDYTLFTGTPHNALHDAIFQASYVSIAIQELREAIER